MITEIIMPKNGMDMTEGVLVRWLKNEGDPVEYEEPIFVVETDKITMESEAPAKGVLLKKLYEDGTTLPVFTVLGYIGEAGDKIPENTEQPKQENNQEVPENADKQAVVTEKPVEVTPANTGEILATPYAKALANEHNISLSVVTPTGRSGEIRGSDVRAALSKSTPLARAIAAEENVKIDSLNGSGFAGKVVKADLQQENKPCAAPVTNECSAKADEVVNVPMNGMRKAIAKNMSSSHSNIPSVTQCVRVDVTELLSLREKLNEGREKAERITVNDFIVKAVAMAIIDNERFRMTFNEDHFELHSAIDVGVAVGTEGGLIVPVVRNADVKSLANISKEVKALAGKAKNKSLSANECGNARISITNLGMYGVCGFTPVINEPEAAIVGVCATEDFPAIENGNLVNKKKLTLCVTFDHRILNGTEVCAFENQVKALLENPYKLLF